MFDFAKRDTFDGVDKWISKLQDHEDIEKCAVMILGNKFDKDNRELSDLDLEKYTDSSSPYLFYPTSARTGY